MEYNLTTYQKSVKFLATIQQSFIGFLVLAIRHFINNPKNNIIGSKNDVTLVITSCNRIDNLQKTIKSFLFFNTYKLKRVVHIEDGQCIESLNYVKNVFSDCEVISIFNQDNIGQLNSIDKAYKYVDTEYIFHLEEDWTFLDYSFIEYSLGVLQKYRNVVFVSLRAFDDQNRHPVQSYNDNFFFLKPFWKLVWVGFGFNPSLRRLSDYKSVSKYGGINKRETGIGLFYYLVRKQLVLVSKTKSFVEHNGWAVSTINKYKKA